MFEALAYASQIYYDFLERNQRSLEKISIFKKEKINPQEIKLILGTRYIHTEFLVLSIQDKTFMLDGEDIKFQYDENKGEMILSADNVLIEAAMRHEIQLFCDLKFLVENVQKFYEKNGDHMHLMFHEKHLKAIEETKKDFMIPFKKISYLDQYQNQALEMIFNAPISYVWGPPGSGKTKAVLLEALLLYMAKKRKVLLLAPTNNALDQILFGILPRVQQNGYALADVLRLGIPSHAFLTQYSMVCDPNVMAKKAEVDLFNLSAQKSYKDRLKDSLILAMTVDGFIKRYDSLSGIDHIFLDEAPYTSLIKALCLSYIKAPITFLGDHKQLGPVCEANEKDFLQESILMRAWSLSALYVEEYSKKEEALFNDPPDSPTFDKLQHTRLLQSYRYGQNLTTILDNFVYNIGLKGLSSEDTEIFFIDSGSHFINAKQYESFKEAQILSQITVKFVKQENRENRSDLFAVITPFNLQRRLILRTARHLRDKVFTIHKSQGLEFDCVFLSPVILHYHLTDSRNPYALQALNVAISRARKRIVIVCDYEAWRRQKDQFIHVLLKCARPYPKEFY